MTVEEKSCTSVIIKKNLPKYASNTTSEKCVDEEGGQSAEKILRGKRDNSSVSEAQWTGVSSVGTVLQQAN